MKDKYGPPTKKSDIKKNKNKQLVVINAEPKDPNCLPNNPARQESIL